jgi:ribokinase
LIKRFLEIKSGMKPKILVIGSANMDMVIQSDHFPLPGETLIGGDFSLVPGGKGANQAVAAARLGGQVCFISKLGQDVFGNQNLSNFQNEKIDTQYIQQIPETSSGVALITVDKSGENTIIVALGANHRLVPEDLMVCKTSFENADIILIQLEIPLDTVMAAVEIAHQFNKSVILNPAPAAHLSDKFLSRLFLITPNETEAEFYTGIKVIDANSAKKAAFHFLEKGVQNVIITLGPLGAYVHTKEFEGIIPTAKVTAKDTTAAGDTFNGALAVILGQGTDMVTAVRFALKAATLSVQRVGAQTSIPYLNDLGVIE